MRTVAERGFDFDTSPHFRPDDEVPCLWLDCPVCGQAVLLSPTGPEDLPEVAECENCETLYDFDEDEIHAADPIDVLTQAAERQFVRLAA